MQEPIVLTDGTVLREGRDNIPIHRAPDSSYQNYLFGSAGTGDKPAWSDSLHGRATIRLISRGIVGAAFFTVGGRMARSQMEGYNQAEYKFSEFKPSKWLQAVAKGIDVTLGRGVEEAVTAGAKLKYEASVAEQIGKEAVTFRHSRNFDFTDSHGVTHTTKGRSYGAEIVSFTFDFAMASIGDATTRNVIQALDPNIKKKWLVNDHGDPAEKGERHHFKAGEAAKAFTRASWRIFSKNQLEDWAAAIPYAFQMKLQSHVINHAAGGRFNGHEIVFDKTWNGGAYKLGNVLNKETGLMEKKIVGDYQLPGAIDLHLRFVGYNWYTLMFREGYDTIGNALGNWKDNGFALHLPKLPEHFNPVTAAIDTVSHSMRYVTKSFIKANMYMNPAVVPFWVMRVSQSKWRGEQYVNLDGARAKLGGDTHIFSSGTQVPDKLNPHDPSNFTHYPDETLADKAEKKFSQGMNVIGKFQYKAGKCLGRKVVSFSGDGTRPLGKWFDNLITYDIKTHDMNGAPFTATSRRVKGLKNLTHEFSDASFAYTPYMFAKGELGLLVDDNKGDGKPGQMDQAIYRFMDNVASFNLHGIMNSGKEMWKLGTHFERDLQMREGGSVETRKKVPIVIPGDLPMNSVDAASVERSAASRNIAADNEHGDTNQDDKTWAQTVMSHKLNPAQFHSASPTRH